MNKFKSILLLAIIITATACSSKNELGNKEVTNTGSKTTYYYEFGTPTTSSTTDYKKIDEPIFGRLDSKNNKYAVCTYYNEKLECFEQDSYEKEKEHAKEMFPSSCIDLNDGRNIKCSAKGKEWEDRLEVRAYDDGTVDLIMGYVSCGVSGTDKKVSCDDER